MPLPGSREEAKRTGSKYYLSGTPCINGHLDKRSAATGRCVICHRQSSSNWHDANAETIKEKKRKRHAENADSINERKRLKYALNPEAERERNKKWRDECGSTYYIDYYNKNRSKDPKYRIDRSIRRAMGKSLAGGGKAGRSWESLIGYTTDDLMRHLEERFQPGMSWDNYGDWHIDHKIPKSVFNYNAPEDIDFNRCWSMSNLQPLWKADNLSKGAILDKPFQPSLAL